MPKENKSTRAAQQVSDQRESLYEFGKRPGEKVVASLSPFRGEVYLDLRCFWEGADGEWHPTRKGVTIAADLLEELEKAVGRLRAALERRGLAA